MVPGLRLLKFEFDTNPFWRRGSSIIFVVSGLHIMQALMMMIWPVSSGATCLLALVRVFHSAGSPDGLHFISFFMLASVLLAMYANLMKIGKSRLFLFIPQHILLGIMAGGGVLATWEGRYLDGTVIPWQHVWADQSMILAAFLMHTLAILLRCWDPDG
jgi:hypothetical protein